MARKKTRQTRIILTNPFSEMSASPDKPLSGISTLSYLAPGKENFVRYWIALKKLQSKLMVDFLNGIPDLHTSKRKSFLLTLNEDGSLDLTDVQSVSLETASEHADTCVFLATFKTVKLS